MKFHIHHNHARIRCWKGYQSDVYHYFDLLEKRRDVAISNSNNLVRSVIPPIIMDPAKRHT